MNKDTETALKNYDWLMRHRDGVGIEWNTGTLLYGDGGANLDTLLESGFTPATREDLE